jgi:hypothetical protein
MCQSALAPKSMGEISVRSHAQFLTGAAENGEITMAILKQQGDRLTGV